MFRYLDSSRRPSGPERLLLSLRAPPVRPARVAHAPHAAVGGEGTGGCSSLGVCTPAAPLPAETTIQLSDTGRADYFAVSSGGRGPDGHVSVVLHVVEGRLHELEIFAGEGVAVDPASVTALTRPEVG